MRTKRRQPPKPKPKVQPRKATVPPAQAVRPAQPLLILWDTVSYIPDGNGTGAAARIELTGGGRRQVFYLSRSGRETMELHFRK